MSMRGRMSPISRNLKTSAFFTLLFLIVCVCVHVRVCVRVVCRSFCIFPELEFQAVVSHLAGIKLGPSTRTACLQPDVNFLLYRHEDLGSDPQYPYEKLGGVAACLESWCWESRGRGSD